MAGVVRPKPYTNGPDSSSRHAPAASTRTQENAKRFLRENPEIAMQLQAKIYELTGLADARTPASNIREWSTVWLAPQPCRAEGRSALSSTSGCWSWEASITAGCEPSRV